MEDEYEINDLVRYYREIVDGKHSRQCIGIGHITQIEIESDGVTYYKIHDEFVRHCAIIFRIPIDLMR